MHAVNVFLGNPGTGKSTVAKILADMLHSLGELQKSEVHEVEYKDLISHDRDDPCAAAIRAARGGILMVNDAHKLVDERSRDSSSGHRVISALVKECAPGQAARGSRQQFVLILSGPRSEMESFLHSGGVPLAKVVTTTLEFPDLSADECALVARSVAREKGFALGTELSDGVLADIFRRRLRRVDSSVSNGLAVHSVLMEAIRSQVRPRPGLTLISAFYFRSHICTVHSFRRIECILRARSAKAH